MVRTPGNPQSHDFRLPSCVFIIRLAKRTHLTYLWRCCFLPRDVWTLNSFCQLIWAFLFFTTKSCSLLAEQISPPRYHTSHPFRMAQLPGPSLAVASMAPGQWTREPRFALRGPRWPCLKLTANGANFYRFFFGREGSGPY